MHWVSCYQFSSGSSRLSIEQTMQQSMKLTPCTSGWMIDNLQHFIIINRFVYCIHTKQISKQLAGLL